MVLLEVEEEMSERKSITFVGWIGIVLGVALIALPVAACAKTGNVYIFWPMVGFFFVLASVLWARR